MCSNILHVEQSWPRLAFSSFQLGKFCGREGRHSGGEKKKEFEGGRISFHSSNVIKMLPNSQTIALNGLTGDNDPLT